MVTNRACTSLRSAPHNAIKVEAQSMPSAQYRDSISFHQLRRSQPSQLIFFHFDGTLHVSLPSPPSTRPEMPMSEATVI